MTIGEKIKRHRKLLKLTQTELGERLGVKKNAVSKWECGRVDDIPASKIKAMAQIFHVPPSYLIDDDTEVSPLLSPEDEALLYAYHNATPEDRAIIDNIIQRYLPLAENSVKKTG